MPLADGQTLLVQGSAKRPYELKNTGGVFSCSCPAWRNQSVPIERRTCKHLKKELGEAREAFRCLSDVQKESFAEAADDTALMEQIKGRNLRADEKAKLNGPPVMLAHPYDGEDPTGWLFSEKLDGVRGYWTGEEFLSRQGNVFHAPDWFKEGLPKHPLDGELYLGRKAFEETISIVKRLEPDERWKKIRYMVFDVPIAEKPFEERLLLADCLTGGAPHAEVLFHGTLAGKFHLLQLLQSAEQAGAEGLMIRKPGSLYKKGRSYDLLKVKPFKDAEATVLGYEPGKGRHKGRVGALTVVWNGVTFELGTGLTDRDREAPPAVGSKVTFSYTELTKAGVPKCAAFVRRRPTE